MTEMNITNGEFAQFQKLLERSAGISLADSKHSLVVSRLSQRLQHLHMGNFSQYLHHITVGNDQAELQKMVDLLTTNETSFFREKKHFDWLRTLAEKKKNSRFRIWSAACSSGEEPYSIAMTLMDVLGDNNNWQVVATDISNRILEKARQGHYPIERASGISQEQLRAHCLKGVGEQSGTFLMSPAIKSHIIFKYLNLNGVLPSDLGVFDVIFLRNVMIYFNESTRSNLVNTLTQKLQRGGYLIISHTENLNGINKTLVPLQPSIFYRE